MTTPAGFVVFFWRIQGTVRTVVAISCQHHYVPLVTTQPLICNNKSHGRSSSKLSDSQTSYNNLCRCIEGDRKEGAAFILDFYKKQESREAKVSPSLLENDFPRFSLFRIAVSFYGGKLLRLRELTMSLSWNYIKQIIIILFLWFNVYLAPPSLLT